ncbi:hypothetical protein PM8797T_21033 [Gimesia maris DSM 8797]|nr:hypothetical protein PM8797T_21033 [Gimesia maris DSM 8797]
MSRLVSKALSISYRQAAGEERISYILIHAKERPSVNETHLQRANSKAYLVSPQRLSIECTRSKRPGDATVKLDTV